VVLHLEHFHNYRCHTLDNGGLEGLLAVKVGIEVAEVAYK
jgi:hypothetical protein